MMKKVIGKIKEFVNRHYVFIVYVVIPIVVICLTYFVLYKYLKEYVSSTKVDDIIIENSQDTIDRVFAPFISSLLIIIGLLVTIVVIKFIDSFCDKNNQKFDALYAKKILFIVTILTGLLSAIVFFYSRANSFEYWNYGIKNIKIIEGYFKLEHIPSIRGGNLTSEKAPIFYRVIYCLANLLEKVKDYFDIIISFVGAVLIPLSIKYEKTNSTKDCKELKRKNK